MGLSDERSEIAFFDLETTVPTRSGQGFCILEFGSILVCPRKLVELESYSTLVRPSDLSLISNFSVRCNGITRDAVISAPTFADIADRVYDILNGRIWAGHNILRFDCPRIREAFAAIGRPAPEPKGTIDSLALLTQRFGRRAGDMKMATLATYFGLGQQTHRSLDDVRMNLEVLKYCATVLFLESSIPELLTESILVSPNAPRSYSAVKSSPQGTMSETTIPSSSSNLGNGPILSPTNQTAGQNHRILSHMAQSSNVGVANPIDSNTTESDPFDLHSLSEEMKTESLQTDINMEEKHKPEASETFSTATSTEGFSNSADFLESDDVSISSISATVVPLFRGYQKIILLHKEVDLQLCCSQLKVRFGISTKFVDSAGRPRLSLVVDASPSLCRVLDACDGAAQKLFFDSGSSSEWRPVLIRKNGFFNCPTVRLNIPTTVCGDVATYATEIYQKESSSPAQRIVFSKFDAAELDSLFTPGTFIDAFFSLDTYDYQQTAGIRLVAKKLIIHPQ